MNIRKSVLRVLKELRKSNKTILVFAISTNAMGFDL